MRTHSSSFRSRGTVPSFITVRKCAIIVRRWLGRSATVRNMLGMLPRSFWNVSKIGATSGGDRKSTRLNSSHDQISYAVFCLKKKKNHTKRRYSSYTHTRDYTSKRGPYSRCVTDDTCESLHNAMWRPHSHPTSRTIHCTCCTQ